MTSADDLFEEGAGAGETGPQLAGADLLPDPAQALAPAHGADAWAAPSPVAYATDPPVRYNTPGADYIGTEGNFTNQDVNGILSGYAWDATELTYSFPARGRFYGNPYGSDEHKEFRPLLDTQQDAVRFSLDLVSQYTGLRFTEVTETETEHATLRFANSYLPPTSWAYYPGPYNESGDVWLGNIMDDPATVAGYALNTIMHEIGHAIGLKHGHETEGFGALPEEHNSTEWSVMTYFSYLDSPVGYYANAEGSGNQTYMANDIAALQHLYGANYKTYSGNTNYSCDAVTGVLSINGQEEAQWSEDRVYQSLWDGNGTDTYNLSGYSTDMQIDLRPGEWSTFSRAQLADLDEYIAGSEPAHGNVLNSHLFKGDRRSLIENARAGSGDDLITGNDGANLLVGGGGLDKLEGLEVSDRLKGDAGGDSLYGADGEDRLKGGGGGDLMFGGADADVVQGNTGADTLTGGAGADLLSGGSQADTFVFRGRFDADVVSDFAVAGEHDVIQFGLEVFGTFADVQGAISQVGADVLIEAGFYGSVLLTDVLVEALTEDHFAFVT